VKTPGEILFHKHQAVQPKLDAVRERFTAMLPSLTAETVRPPHSGSAQSSRRGWRDLIPAVRWHLAGLAATWLLIALFHVADTSPAIASPVQAKAASPRAVILALKANRRQVLEFGGASLPTASAALPARNPGRRSSLETDRAYS
jgi:hypothetical protein